MNSILRSWHQKGLHTVAQIKAGDSAGRAAKSSAAPPPPTPAQSGQRVAESAQWMREFLAKQKKEEG